jgi:ribosomal protein S18 acetylase RimI-like enzyme
VADVRIVDVVDVASFGLVPPCADPAFDHRTCDYWEDAARGSKVHRESWLVAAKPREPAANPVRAEPAANPFAPRSSGGEAAPNPFAPAGDRLADNPFARRDDDEPNPFLARPRSAATAPDDAPPKLRLLVRGAHVFGSYAKVLQVDGLSVAYAQYGPLTAYPRAQRLRDLYPQLPDSPPPAVITCIATTAEGRSQGWAARLVGAVCDDLGERGFVAVEAYPEVDAPPDATSAATVEFWLAAGFAVAADDDRFPVMRRELA